MKTAQRTCDLAGLVGLHAALYEEIYDSPDGQTMPASVYGDAAPGLAECAARFDEFLSEHCEEVGAFAAKRRDCVSSDREAAAFTAMLDKVGAEAFLDAARAA